jgi:class 3 adenylate cyclase/HAMP domain-containing protein
MNISIGGQLSQYKTIFGTNDNSIGVLGISISADKYALTRISAIITLIIIMLVCIGGAYILGMILSRSIVSPIKKLLEGVKRISSGDLTYEMKPTSKDEIGILSAAFDDMRVYLNEMITTIEKANGELEKVNQGLESEVKKRTEKIESLLNKLKKYLSPQLYDSILGGTRDTSVTVHSRKKLTVFFSDIVSFTSTTESMEAEDLSDLLNNYLDNMAKIALKWGGTIDKFVGDAIMIFFGDPEFINDKEHSLRAVKMSLEMMERMKELREEWRDKGIEKPLHVRIGINTGYCTVGNFGSENRMDYTIIGGNVNLASRLETSADPDTIHISYETYSLIKDEIECVPVGELTLKVSITQ